MEGWSWGKDGWKYGTKDLDGMDDLLSTERVLIVDDDTVELATPSNTINETATMVRDWGSGCLRYHVDDPDPEGDGDCSCDFWASGLEQTVTGEEHGTGSALDFELESVTLDVGHF